MEKGHFAIVFFIVLLYCSLELSAEKERYCQVVEEKQRIEESLLYAVEAAAWEMLAVLEEPEEIKLYTLSESFFEAWHIRLGISDNEEEKEKMQVYIPLLAWIEEDCCYFLHMEEVWEGGIGKLVRKWSDGIPGNYCTEQGVDRDVLIRFLEKHVSELISEHNRIASNQGVRYQFSAPHFLTKSEVGLPMLIVVFQGWPLEGSGKILYENCLDANVYIQSITE